MNDPFFRDVDFGPEFEKPKKAGDAAEGKQGKKKKGKKGKLSKEEEEEERRQKAELELLLVGVCACRDSVTLQKTGVLSVNGWFWRSA